jgi:hypothetical protein
MNLPPELICMVKSSLTNRDLYFVELTCRYLFLCTVSNKEWQLRKCKLWNNPPSKITYKFYNAIVYCSHVCCWKYRCQYLSYEDIKYLDHYAFRCAAGNGHLPVVQYLCEYRDRENRQLTIQDVRSRDNYALGCAASNGHLQVVQYLCEKFQLTIRDVRSDDNYALRRAAGNGHLPVVQYLCEKFQLTIQDVRSDDNCALRWAASNGFLPVVRYLCDKFQLTLEDVRTWNNWALRHAARFGHLWVVQYLRRVPPIVIGENRGGALQIRPTAVVCICAIRTAIRRSVVFRQACSKSFRTSFLSCSERVSV